MGSNRNTIIQIKELNELFEGADLEPAKAQRLLRFAQLQSQSVEQENGTWKNP